MPDKVSIYRWGDAPIEFRRRFPKQGREFIVHVSEGVVLSETHFSRRLTKVVEKTLKTGGTLIAGDEVPAV